MSTGRSNGDRQTIGRVISVAPWIGLFLAGLLGALPLIPPGAPENPGPTDFSTIRAQDLVADLAQEPHPIGTPAIERVRAMIVDELRGLGLAPEFQEVEASDYYGGTGARVTAVNVLARISGAASTGAVAVVGHYDTVPWSPGANDDASAVAIMLESARALLATPPARNDVMFVFTDGEEPAPRFGSTAFVSHHRWAQDIKAVINLETIGGSGPSMLIATGGSDHWIIDRYAEAVPDPVAFSFVTTLAKLIGGSSSDFASFRDRGIPGAELAYLRGSPIYHTERDTPDRVDGGSLTQQGSATLALTRELAGLDLGPVPTPEDAVFFTLGGSVVVRYPATWALPVALVAGLSIAVAAWLRRRAGRDATAGARSMKWGVGATLGAVAAATLAGIVVWTVLATARPDMDVPESYAYLAGLSAMTAGVAVALGRLAGRRAHADPVGVLAVWWILALFTSIGAPGFSYLFAWPVMAAGLVLAWRAWHPEQVRSWSEAAGFALVGVITLALLVPPIDTFFQLAQPRPGNPDSEMPAIVAVVAILTVLAIELIRTCWPRARARSGTPDRAAMA
jgi:hypothetical protein